MLGGCHSEGAGPIPHRAPLGSAMLALYGATAKDVYDAIREGGRHEADYNDDNNRGAGYCSGTHWQGAAG